MEKCSVSVCMGSSCFLRGNKEMMIFIKELISSHSWENYIELKGDLCSGHCSKGPVIKIDGAIHNGLSLMSVEEVLKSKIEDGKEI